MLKFNSITSAALLLLSSVAFAQQTSAPTSASAGLTRAEVMAELARAKANGELTNHGEMEAEPIVSRAAGAQGRAFSGPGLTRAEVKAELARARANGELTMDGEAQAEPIVSRAAGARGRSFEGPGLTRAEVKAELARARASGEMARFEESLRGGSE